MSERIVDVLEAVEVEEHQSQWLVIALGEVDGLIDTVGQQRAVRQAGQHIVLGQLQDARFGLLLLGEIAQGDIDDGTSRQRDGDHADLGREVLAAETPSDPLEAAAAVETGRFQHLQHTLATGRAIGLMRRCEAPERPVQQVFRMVGQQVERGRVAFDDFAAFHDQEAVRTLVEQQVELGLAIGQIVFGLLAARLPVEVVERETDIESHLDQQALDRVLESMGLPGVEVERTGHVAAAQNGDGGRSAPGATAAFMPGGSLTGAGVILAPVRLAVADRLPGRPLAMRTVRLGGDADILQVTEIIAVTGSRVYHAGLVIDHADPGHLHAAESDGHFTDLAEQLLLAGAAHDGLVALGQCGI